MQLALFKDDSPLAARQPKTDRLILARYLKEAGDDQRLDRTAIDAANAILIRWADSEKMGRLDELTETQLQGDFLREVFGDALEYARAVENKNTWNLEQHYNIEGETPDAVLGQFEQGQPRTPLAVVELKGSATHLDRDRSNGRTAVDQCWDYLVNVPANCRWGIVSNIISFRLYERDSTKRVYEHFTLQSLRDPAIFRQFYALFHRKGLIESTAGQPPRAITLLQRTQNRQREVGDKLYDAYSVNRANLIAHLRFELGHPIDLAIEMAQRLFDRIMFIAFCEDRGLLPEASIPAALRVAGFHAATNPKWQNFKNLFRFIDLGSQVHGIEKYNGGLFAPHAVDDLELPDEPWTTFFDSISNYNFADEVNLDVLGHLFERSITELEKAKLGGLFGDAEKAERFASMPQSAKRKQLGIYYTPPELTSRIVQYTVEDLIDERFADLAVQFGIKRQDALRNILPEDEAFWRGCLDILRNLKIVDPACGSGAFLFQAYNVLEARYFEVIGHLEQFDDPPLPPGEATSKLPLPLGEGRGEGALSADELADDVPNFILQGNLYGVDLSPEAVEITQLALWIRSATKGQTLATLSKNIVHGNSLVHDPAAHPAGFNWHQRFPEVFPPLPSGEGRGEGRSGEGALSPTAKSPLPTDLLEFARDLRKSQTDAESLMWNLLRNRRLGGHKFRRQHPVEPYILDFYCHDKRLAIELDGGQHNTETGRESDESRTKLLAQHGIQVLRFWNHDVLQDTDPMLEAIWQALNPTLPPGEGRGEGAPRKAPHPNPLPKGEGINREPGFDCVIGNPPWERIKLQEREFFSLPAPEIATATNAATRRKLVTKLESDDPALYQRYQDALTSADSLLTYCRAAGAYPLTGRGDINLYAVFAELAHNLVAPHGRVGLLTPSGIASDKTTMDFFAAIAETNRLIRLYDFENRTKKFFPEVDNRFKFCILNFGGSAYPPLPPGEGRGEGPSSKRQPADFIFFVHNVEELDDPVRHIALTGDDIKLLNPNTRTCPIFRTRRDAEITKAVYRRVPILIDHNRQGPTANPWGIKFKTMFHQTNDAELFHEADSLKKDGFKLKSNRWVKGKQTYLPLYEAKMLQAYDHRAADVVTDKANWVRQGQTEKTALVSSQNPEHLAMPRFWVLTQDAESPVDGLKNHFLAYKDVTSPTNQRTMISAMTPFVGVVNSAPLIFTSQPPRRECCLLANLNSFAYDFVMRQKISNVHLNFFVVEQVPTLTPDVYAKSFAWIGKKIKLETWISERVLKLTCTAEDMLPLAEACDFTSGSFKKEYGGRLNKWDEAERAQLMAELDAAYFLLYGIDRDDAQYILSTFKGIHDATPLFPGSPTTAQHILATYDEFTSRM